MILRSFGFNIGINLIIGILLFTGLKSCIVSGVAIDDYILLKGQNDQEKIIITPNKKIIFTKELSNTNNYAVYELRGKEATPYFSGLFCVGAFPFGLKHYSGVEKVIESELVLLKKQGDQLKLFDDSLKTRIVIYDHKVQIGADEFNRVSVNSLRLDECAYMLDHILLSQK